MCTSPSITIAGLLVVLLLAHRPAAAFLSLDPSSAAAAPCFSSSSRPKSLSSSAAVPPLRATVVTRRRFQPSITTSSSRRSRLYYFNFPYEGSGDPRPVEELEKARAAFEALVARQHDPNALQQQQQQQQGSMNNDDDDNSKDNNSNVVGQQQTPTPAGAPSSSSPPPVPNSNSNNIRPIPLNEPETTPQAATNSEEAMPKEFLLTNAGRRLRELEIELLESLATSDAAVDELIHLWTTEPSADPAASISILAMGSGDGECSEGLVREEAVLRRVAERYPGWAEPRARLATLLYYQGRAPEAVDAAERALRLKPWHFEALQIAAQLAQQQQQSQQSQSSSSSSSVRDRAQRLARRALPPLADARARRVWVDRAVAQALQQLRDAELALQRHANLQSRRRYIFRQQDIWQ